MRRMIYVPEPMTAAEVKNFGFSFITNLSNRFFEEFWTARSTNTRKPIEVIT